MKAIVDTFRAHTDEFVEVSAASPFTVFLCGPALGSKTAKSAAKLRQDLKEALEAEKFKVVLGEDDSIANQDLKDIGINLQDSELEFLVRYCNAIVIVAASPGSFCEVGLFSWHFVHKDGRIKDHDFILLIDKKFENKSSYLNDGPAAAVNGFGRRDFVNFAKYDPQKVVEKLKHRRGVLTIDRRGRPRGSKS